MTFVLCAGQIDLSVGSIIGFAGVCMGMLYHAGLPAGAAIFAGLLIALGIGLVNGALVAYGKINSFIVTLSMMTILRGFVLIMTNSSSVFGFGPVFTFIGSGSVGPVNMPILLSLVIAAAGAVTLHKTKFGNYCLFLGSNEIALHRSGVNVKKYKLIIFAVCGLCAGVAGLIVTSRLNSAEPLAGQGYEMDAIAAAILGGTSMRGGKGSLIGTIIACLILNVLKNPFNMVVLVSLIILFCLIIIPLLTMISSTFTLAQGELRRVQGHVGDFTLYYWK